MKKAYKFLSFIAAVAIVLSCSLTAFADAVYQTTGNVKVRLLNSDNETPQKGAEVTLYHVADAEITQESYKFTYTKDFEDCSDEELEITDANTYMYYNYVMQNNISGITRSVGSDGYANFDNIKLGLYLAVQTKAADENTVCDPFLITLPQGTTSDPQYDITAAPKTATLQIGVLSVKKVWNDTGDTNRPVSITVSLMRDEQVVDTVTLSKENNWEHKWYNLPMSDDYSVKEEVPDGYTVTYERNGYAFTITNSDKLVQTGQLNWPIPVLAGTGLVLIAIGFAVVQKGKLKDEK